MLQMGTGRPLDPWRTDASIAAPRRRGRDAADAILTPGCYDAPMRKTPTRASRRKNAPRRRSAPSTAALRAMVRPIVRELMAEELERLEDRLDAQDAREALAEPGGITHEELVKKLGL
jgi:hypothetical protein